MQRVQLVKIANISHGVSKHGSDGSICQKNRVRVDNLLANSVVRMAFPKEALLSLRGGLRNHESAASGADQ